MSGRVLFFYKQLELVGVLGCLVFHGIVINIKFSRLSAIFATQFELEFLPGVILTDLVFLRIKKIEMR